MQKSILIVFLLALISYSGDGKWTKIRDYGHEEEALEGKTHLTGVGQVLQFEGESGLFVSINGHTNISFFKTTDRGDTWKYTGEMDSLGVIMRNNEYYINSYGMSEMASSITAKSLYVLFFNRSSSNKNAVYKLDDSTITANAVVMNYDRFTDSYSIINTNLENQFRAIDFKVFDGKTGYILTFYKLYKSEDSCKTWTVIHELNDSTDSGKSYRDISIPSEDKIYLTINHNTIDSYLYCSDNGGISWDIKDVNGLGEVYRDSDGNGIGVIYDFYLVEDTNSYFYNRTIPYKRAFCKTNDNFETFDTLLIQVDSTGFVNTKGNFIRKDSIILAYWQRLELGVISYDSGNSFESLEITGYEDDLRNTLFKHASIVDGNRLYFDTGGSSKTWCIYDRETSSGIEYEDIFKDTQMKIYPNIISNNESVTVELESSKGQEITFEILDYTGRCIERYTDTCTRDNLKIKYEPERNLASGMYLMTASSGGKLMAAQKFMIRER